MNRNLCFYFGKVFDHLKDITEIIIIIIKMGKYQVCLPEEEIFPTNMLSSCFRKLYLL